MTLTATLLQQREQQRIRDAGLRDVRRAGRRGSRFAARMLGTYQARMIAAALAATPDVLDEQGISTAQVAAPEPDALLTGAAAAEMFDKAANDAAFDNIVLALMSDAGRTASAVDVATRPAVTGKVRAITTPCCSRCAILAGRVYRWNADFPRHPRCDCVPVPTTMELGRKLATDPTELFESGQIQTSRLNSRGERVYVPGLSRADTKAVNDGADLAQVVNIRRKAAGLVEGSSVMVRGGRPTPQFILRVASDRGEALSLLARHGYVT